MNTATTADQVITLTASAAAQIQHLTGLDPENADKYLRVFVEQGGCSGLQYGMVFDEARPDDFRIEMFDVLVLVDPFSAGHLRGAEVDFQDTLNASGFKVTNPNARQSCGCGKSFQA